MKRLRITRKDNGAGLGDVINQINFIYRISQKINASYIHSPIISSSHNQNYDPILGLNKYPDIKKTGEETEVITIESLFLKYELGNLSDEILYEVAYDYKLSSIFLKELGLSEFSIFPWRTYFISTDLRSIDDLIHLRFGDSFCYPLAHNYFFDARYKKIIKYPAEGCNRYIWNLKNLEKCLQSLVNKQNIYIISDGIDSALRSLKWNDFGAGFPLDFVREAVLDQYNKANLLVQSYGLSIGQNDLVSDLNAVLSAKKIIATEGNFVRSINRFLKEDPVQIVDITSYK
jgi:hypothetical protein